MSGDLLFESPGHHVYDGIIYTVGFDIPVLDRIRNGEFQLHQDDILVSSYPKAGTSWMQNIVSLLCAEGDLAEIAKQNLDHRVPFMEFTERGHQPLLDKIEADTPPRILKTHLPARFFTKQANMLARKTKVIYVMRNPKDTLVSYYNFYRMNEYFGCFSGSWSEYFELFKRDQIGLGNWFDMVLEWWQYKDKYNVLFVKYEDLKQDPQTWIKKIADFLEKLISQDRLSEVVSLTTFSKMSTQLAGVDGLHHEISPFFRKGEVADWKNYFTDEESEYFDKVYEERMKDSGLDFDFS